MKIVVLILFLSCISAIKAHDYYFSFAEMQYNTDSKRFEASIRATGHDVEEFIKDREQEIPSLEKCIGNPVAENILESYVTKYFKVLVDGKPLEFTLVGLEVNLKDEVIFYIKSNKLEKPKAIEIIYDLLMDYFPDQQNKLTLFTAEGKEYLGFLPHRRKRIYEYDED